jgi:transcriptional regulator with XRE-family HTH domain
MQRVGRGCRYLGPLGLQLASDDAEFTIQDLGRMDKRRPLDKDFARDENGSPTYKKEQPVSESAQIIDVLKRNLKSRGLTYRDIAKKVGLSEASIKRVFAEETFTLQRLEKICEAVGITVAELVKSASAASEPRSQYLSIEQEQLLASDAKLLACFYLVLNGHSSDEIIARMDLNERSLRSLYVKLDAVRLIELLPKLKARLRVGPVVTWRMDGPVHKLYEQQVKDEFLQSEFQGACDALHFRTAELSEASAKILLRKLNQLAQEFADYAALDVNLPSSEKRSVALLLAFRPWVFSMFDGLRPAQAVAPGS